MTRYRPVRSNSVTVQRCARGFTATDADMNYGIGRTFAFDRIEDLAKWLVEEAFEAEQ